MSSSPEVQDEAGPDGVGHERRLRRVPDVAQATAALADQVEALLRRRAAEGRRAVLGLPTGRTPAGFYAELVRRHREEGLSFAHVTTFNLDEYVGLAPQHPGSFQSAMQRALFAHVDLDPANTHLPRPRASYAAAAAEYEARIRDAGGIDWMLLGLGTHGHVAINEPGAALDSRTRLVELAASTRAAVAADFPRGAPTHGLTLGLANVLEARALRLAAFGAGKAAVVARLLREAPSTDLPASLLGAHPDLELWVDAAAAADLAPA